MKFCIRDDDTCYYTNPTSLESVFGDIWDDAPVTLACIPMVSPDTDAQVDAAESVPMPIEANNSLQSYLSDRLDEGVIEIALHGYHHDYPNGKPEFVNGRELTKKVQAGRQQLEQALKTEVQLFVPPHVRLSNRGVQAVRSEGLNIVRGYGPQPREIQPTPRWLIGYAKLLKFYFHHGKKVRYPNPIDYGTHRELYSHRLNDQTDMSWCKQAFDYIEAKNGVFCLSIHANGLTEDGKRKLDEIINYAKRRNAEFVTASEALEVN